MTESNITQRAYDLLRQAIIDCKLTPGSTLNISALQSDLGLSQSAVREALSRLAAEGLVQMSPNRGFSASPLSVDGFRDLTQALMTVELPCIRMSIEQGDTDWELNLVSAYHRAVRTLELVVEERQDLSSYWAERLGFYEALLAGCSNRWLLWSWRLLYTQNMRYRHMYLPLARFELDRHSHHEAFMNALLKRDLDRVIELAVLNYDELAEFIETKMAADAGGAITKKPTKRARTGAAIVARTP